MSMNRVSGAAARLPEAERKALAVRALRGLESITELADEIGVSRKFVYTQTHRAGAAFATAANDDNSVLFDLRVTQEVVEQMILGLTLVCRASYRGVIEFMRDCLGLVDKHRHRSRDSRSGGPQGRRHQRRRRSVRRAGRLARRDLPRLETGIGRRGRCVDVLLRAGG